MLEYHKTTKESRVLGFFGLVVVTAIPVGFLWLGIGIMEESGILAATIPLLIGAGFFIAILRGTWELIKGPRIFVLSVDAEKIQCGIEGKERTVFLRNILEIYWNDWDGLTMIVGKQNGKRIRFPYIECILTPKEHRQFIHHMWEFHPQIPIVGNVMGKRYRRKLRKE